MRLEKDCYRYSVEVNLEKSMPRHDFRSDSGSIQNGAVFYVGLRCGGNDG